jgi:hypothetical protein
VAGGFVLLVLALAGLVVVGGGRGVSDDADDEARRERPATTTTTSTTSTTVPDGQGPAVRLHASHPDQTSLSRLPRVVGELEPSTVLSMFVDGFPAFAVARAQQCVAGAHKTCGNSITVQFRENGSALFQYLVHRDFAGSTTPPACGTRSPQCSIVVQNLDGAERVEVTTVFGEPVPPMGRMTVTPRTAVPDGGNLHVALSGQPPGADVVVQLCAVPADRPCGGAGRTARVEIGPDGTGAASLVAACGRNQTCAVRMRSSTALVRTRPVVLDFAAPPGAGYDGWRLGLGLAVAALLAVAATWMVRRTDWNPVGEAAAPEIDDAEYADLDAIIAALPPEEIDAAEIDEELSPARR